VSLPAFAAAALRAAAAPLLMGAKHWAAIDRYLLPTGRSAANLPLAAAAVDRRMDKRTDTGPLHTAGPKKL